MNTDELLTKSYWVADFLPEQVPKYSAGQFSAIEQFYLREPQLSELRKKFLNIVLKLNCFYDISVLTYPKGDMDMEGAEGDMEKAEVNPDPEKMYAFFVGENAAECVQVFVKNEDTLIVSNKDDTCIAIYNPVERVLTMIRRLAEAEGLFVWKP